MIKQSKFKDVTQCFLINLAFSDMIFIIACIPFTSLTYLINGWIFGRFLCKLSQYLTFVTVCASCLGLTMMTIGNLKLIFLSSIIYA
jgi:hypothetical protein